MRPRSWLGPVAVIAVALTPVACLDAASSQLDSPQSVATVTVAPKSAQVAVGSQVTFSASATDQSGQPVGGEHVSWASTDTLVAAVDANGTVTARAVGNASITASTAAHTGTATVSVLPAPIASLTVSPGSASVTIGDTLPLVATPRDANGNVLTGRSISWASSDTTVASVSARGVVTGKSQGSAVIAATSEGVRATSSINVVSVPTPVASVSVAPGTSTILVGATVQLTATPKDAGGRALSGRAVTWHSSDASVATVSASGLVTGVAPGTATLSATSEGKTGTATVHVNAPPAPVAKVVIAPGSASITAGGTQQLAATTLDAGGDTLTGRTVTWSSINASVAAVSSTGLVTAKIAGTSGIIASSEGKADTAAITVTAVPVASVVVTPSSSSVQVGATLQLSAVEKDATGHTLTGRTVTWNSSSSAVATVSSSGLVTAAATGSAKISATSEGKSGSAAITVTASTATHSGWYVTPTGKSSASGTAASPWDMATALAGANGRVHPGDTIWLRAGTYHGAFTSTLTGTTASPIIVRQYPGERATIDGNLVVQGAYTWYWGFEVTTSNPAPNNVEGVDLGGPGVKVINMVVHDNGGDGVGAWSQAPDAEVYGTVVYNNGRQRVETGYAHGIYTQNDQGSKLIQDDILFHQFAYGVHAYTQSGTLHNITVDGTVSFDNGVAVTDPTKSQPDFFFGGGTPLQNITITHDMTWHQGWGGGSVWVGYTSCGCTSTGISMQNNYFVGGNPVLRIENVANLTTSSNTLVATETNNLLVEQTGPVSNYSWSGNTFWGNATLKEFELISKSSYTFSGWKTATGLGTSDTFNSGRPASPKIFVRPNKYEPGRANVIVYNWANQGSVSVDLTGVLTPGEHYEIRNVQNWFGTPVATGTYGGGSVSFPMTAVTPPTPLGGWVTTPPATGPAFNVFVVLPQS